MTRLLDSINDPSDLRPLSIDQLVTLAREIRDYIAEVGLVRGGHFGAPVGAVELALGLHKVYDTPRDIIVWDTGHQAYAHKILTGRRERFQTLRSYKGIAGFLKRSESVYDTFGAGHASTSISAACGFAVARDLRGTDEKVVAVIGDGAMTGGLAFEGLNNIGDRGTDCLVILNDNNMSIAEPTGALSNYINRILTAPLYHRVKDDVQDLLQHLNERTLLDKKYPSVGKAGRIVFEKAMKLKEGLKNMILPSLLFEELGFTYYGPVEGHDLHKLIPMLEDIRKLHGPVLLHVITSKGMGFEWTEHHAEKGHAVKPGFDPKTGKMAPDKIEPPPAATWTSAFADALSAMADEDPAIVAITAAMPSGTGLDRFTKRHAKRCIDVGIAEGHAVVSAAAMAAQGLKPVCAIYSTFLQRAYDMILHDVCIQNLPVFFALDRGGIVGDDGETHQGLFDFGYLRMIPNMRVMAPRNEGELKAMMKLGIGSPYPSAVRYPRGNVVPGEPGAPVEWGKAEVLGEGSDVVILAWGTQVDEALAVARRLAPGLSVGVVNMRFVKPLDTELVLRLAREVGRIVTYEEHVLMTGAGSAVLEAIADAGVACRVRRLGVPDVFVEHGDVKLVKADLGLTVDHLEAAVRELASAPRP